MVPEGWTKQTVGTLFDVQLGKMLNKAAKERSPQEPYLTNFNVRWGTFDTSKFNSMFFSDKDKEKFSLRVGDLLVCEGGEVGRCAIWEEEITPCYYQKALHRLRPKGSVIPQYFQLYMEHIAGTKKLENFTSRTNKNRQNSLHLGQGDCHHRATAKQQPPTEKSFDAAIAYRHEAVFGV